MISFGYIYWHYGNGILGYGMLSQMVSCPIWLYVHWYFDTTGVLYNWYFGIGIVFSGVITYGIIAMALWQWHYVTGILSQWNFDHGILKLFFSSHEYNIYYKKILLDAFIDVNVSQLLFL